MLPKPFIEKVLASDGFWEILAELEEKGVTDEGIKVVDSILDGLSKYEVIGQRFNTVSKVIDNATDYLQRAATPIKEGAKWILEKLSGFAHLEDAVTKGRNLVGNGKFLGKAVKVINNVGTVLTFAQVGYEGISGGIEEYTESKHVGKAIGQGLLDAVSSVGPLEGATIGATFASVVPIPGVSQAAGAGIGFVVGLGIQGIKMLEPKFFDDPGKGTRSIINKTGRAIEDVVSIVTDTFGGVGKALGFG